MRSLGKYVIAEAGSTAEPSLIIKLASTKSSMTSSKVNEGGKNSLQSWEALKKLKSYSLQCPNSLTIIFGCTKRISNIHNINFNEL